MLPVDSFKLASTTSQTLETLKAARRSSSGVSTASILSVSSAALSQAISSIDNGKSAVVIEIGTKLTKLGCAGETSPRNIIRTEFVDEKGRTIPSEDIFALNNQKTIKQNIEYYEEILFKFFRSLFLKVLAPIDRPVVIVESVFLSVDLRDTITKIVLEKLRYKSIMFMPSHVCCTFPFNTQNALVVDIGHSECIAIPVIEGVTMLSEFGSARSFCGKKLEQKVREAMKKYGLIEDLNGQRRPIEEHDWVDIDNIKLIETISIDIVCPNNERAQKWKEWEAAEGDEKPEIKELIPEKLVMVKGKNVVIPSVVMETSCEILFDENLNQDSFDRTLPKLIFEIAGKCPIDLRRKLFSNILLVGGVSMIPGLAYRLKEEIQLLSTENNAKMAEEVKFYQFDKLRNSPIFIGWLGASLMGSLRETVERRSLTLEEWRNGKRASDWTDVIMK